MKEYKKILICDIKNYDEWQHNSIKDNDLYAYIYFFFFQFLLIKIRQALSYHDSTTVLKTMIYMRIYIFFSFNFYWSKSDKHYLIINILCCSAYFHFQQ